MKLQTGKLKYLFKHDIWQIVDEKGNTYDTNSFGLEMAIKVFQYYRVCEILYNEKQSYWYAKFFDLSFVLDKSFIYQVEFQIDEDLMFPF